jgi:hypothetical protein
MRVPLMTCAPYGIAWQEADIEAIPIAENAATAGSGEATFYTDVHRVTDYRWLRGKPSAYFRLEFFPRTVPAYGPKDPCQEEIPPSRARPGTPNFIPLNDAQWTIEGYHGSGIGAGGTNRTGYSIAIPDSGTLRYEDHTSENSSIKPYGIELVPLVKARGIWYITVVRTRGN